MAAPPTPEEMAEKYAGLRKHPELAGAWMAGVAAERKRAALEAPPLTLADTAAATAIFRSKLPARARLVFLAMLQFSARATVGFVNYSALTTIAQRTGLSVRSVKRELDTLGKAGWVRPIVDGHELLVPAEVA